MSKFIRVGPPENYKQWIQLADGTQPELAHYLINPEYVISVTVTKPGAGHGEVELHMKGARPILLPREWPDTETLLKLLGPDMREELARTEHDS